MKKIQVNLGCGVVLLPGFINVDNSFDIKDLRGRKGIFGQAKVPRGARFMRAPMQRLPFKDGSVDYIECLEAIEHLPFRDVRVAIKEMHRVLKPRGKVVLFTTDFDDVAKGWIDFVAGKPYDQARWADMEMLIYGNQLTEGEYHRALFNPIMANTLMQECGFTKFKLVGYPRGTMPPRFKGAKWPKKPMGIGMLYIEAVK